MNEDVRVDLEWSGEKIAEERAAGRISVMVDWLDPRELMRAALRQTYSRTIGAYADLRPLQALTEPPEAENETLPGSRTFRASKEQDDVTWIDFVADLGDGFDATYTVAYLISQASVEIALSDGTPISLPAAQTLILGGDLAYPDATLTEYHNRCVAPYTWASTKAPASGHQTLQKPTRQLLCIAGNHDWHDGLVAFTKTFLSTSVRGAELPNQPHIGAWNVPQTRSYFALAASEHWHIWGVDLGMNRSIDSAQLQYFANALRKIAPGDDVIVLVHEPIWLDRAGLGPIEELLRLLTDRAARVRTLLAGDLHHYMRYEVKSGSGLAPAQGAPLQLITAGGGGAFLHTTHHLPKTLEVTAPKPGDAPWIAEQVVAYPTPNGSRLALKAYFYPGAFFRRVLNWRYILAFGMAYFLIGAANQQVAHEPYTEAQLREARIDYEQALNGFVTEHAPPPTLPDCNVAIWRYQLEAIEQSTFCPVGQSTCRALTDIGHLKAKRLQLYERDRWHNFCFRSVGWHKDEVEAWSPADIANYRAQPATGPDFRARPGNTMNFVVTRNDEEIRRQRDTVALCMSLRGTATDAKTMEECNRDFEARQTKAKIQACAPKAPANIDRAGTLMRCIANYQAAPMDTFRDVSIAFFSRTWHYYWAEANLDIILDRVGSNPFAATIGLLFVLLLTAHTYLAAPSKHRGAPAAAVTRSRTAVLLAIALAVGLAHFYFHYRAAMLLDALGQETSEFLDLPEVERYLAQFYLGPLFGWAARGGSYLLFVMAGAAVFFAMVILTLFAFVLSLGGWHRDLFSSTSVTSYKHFLRFKIDPTGDLTLYVIGIDDVPDGTWVATKAGAVSRIEPATPMRLRLVDMLVFKRVGPSG